MAWRFYTKGGVIVTSDTTDHGALTGLSEDDHPQYILADGTRALSANWDAGSFKITAQQLESDVATGTAPLVVASTTLVTNLNADKVDGKDETAFLLTDGTRVLTGDWDIGDGRKILADQIQARDADGLKLTDDAGNGIFIEDGGDVGIGTTSPGAKLHVSGGDILLDNNQSLRWNKAGGGTLQAMAVDTADGLLFQSARSDFYSVRIRTPDSSGAPADRFVVEGGVDKPRISLKGLTPDAGDPLQDSPYLNLLGYYYDTAGHSYPACIYHDITSTSPTSLLRFDVPSGSTRMVIDNSGNVGIGTTSPGTILEISSIDPKLTLDTSSGGGNPAVYFSDAGVIKAAIDMEGTSNDLRFFSKDGSWFERMRIDYVTGNVGIGTTSPGGGTTAGEHVLSLADVTNVPAGGVSGQVSLYSSGGELYAFDSAGNATLLSPHKFELFEPDPSYELPFSYYSENRFIGKKINVDMYGAIKALEELTGKRFIYVEDLAPEEILDWEENEERLQAKRAKEIEEWKKRKAKYDEALVEHEALPEEERKKATPPEPPGPKPKPHEKRTPPNWMAPRLKKPLRKTKKSGSRGRKKS